MTEPHILFEKLSYFEARNVEGGKDDIVVSHADIGDADLYVATPQYEVDVKKRLRKSGNIVLAQQSEGDQEIVHAEVPEQRPGDPYAPERTLAMLAFAALKDAPDVQADRHEARLYMQVNAMDERTEALYRRTLGMRMRRTGNLTGERDASVILSASQRRAFGNSGLTLRKYNVKQSATPTTQANPDINSKWRAG
jgi:hypothetical protein